MEWALMLENSHIPTPHQPEYFRISRTRPCVLEF